MSERETLDFGQMYTAVHKSSFVISLIDVPIYNNKNWGVNQQVTAQLQLHPDDHFDILYADGENDLSKGTVGYQLANGDFYQFVHEQSRLKNGLTVRYTPSD